MTERTRRTLLLIAQGIMYGVKVLTDLRHAELRSYGSMAP